MKRTRAAMDTGRVSGKEGQWVIVHNGDVVACSDDAGEMFRLAEGYPQDEVVVTKILYDGASFY
jgi:hypothetical protein